MNYFLPIFVHLILAATSYAQPDTNGKLARCKAAVVPQAATSQTETFPFYSYYQVQMDWNGVVRRFFVGVPKADLLLEEAFEADQNKTDSILWRFPFDTGEPRVKGVVGVRRGGTLTLADKTVNYGDHLLEFLLMGPSIAPKNPGVYARSFVRPLFEIVLPKGAISSEREQQLFRAPLTAWEPLFDRYQEVLGIYVWGGEQMEVHPQNNHLIVLQGLNLPSAHYLNLGSIQNPYSSCKVPQRCPE